MPNIKERILQIAENKGISREKFFSTLGLTYSNFKGNARNTPLNSDAIAKILTAYEDIDPAWLITGNGEMIKPVGETAKIYETKVKAPLRDKQSIPLYDLEATAGLVPLFENHNHANPVDHIVIPNLPKCDGAVHVTGDSMYPLLKSGDIVCYKQIHDISNGIFWGEMYLLSISNDSDNYITVKYIQKSDSPDSVKLVSYNKHHQEKDVKIKDIKALALVKASVRINSM